MSQKSPTFARYGYPALGVLAIVAVLGGLKYRQISSLIKMGKQMEQAGPPPESVSTAFSREEVWEGTLTAVGSIAPVRGVSVTTEAPGIVSRIAFESGAHVKAGAVLLELDTSVERAQLASVVARRDLAALTAKRARALLETKSVSEAEVDAADAQLRSATTDVAAIEAQIERKNVKAPFAGRLGIRMVNLGQYLAPGTPIATLEAIESVYVDFALPQQYLASVATGMPVRVTLEGDRRTTTEGRLAAIDPAVDPTTRAAKLRATVPNERETFQPGMFASVAVVLPKSLAFVVVPATAVIHASFGDSVFVVENEKPAPEAKHEGDPKPAPTAAPAPAAPAAAGAKPVRYARQQFVRLGEARGDFVAVLDGVTKGQEVVASGAFKLRNGSPIVMNDDVKLAPELAPRPENR